MSHETDISFLDKPEALEITFPVVYSPFISLFGPRGQLAESVARRITVGENETVVCGFWSSSKDSPTILFFHGNGEVATDYDWIAQYYAQRNINLFVAEYRGYGSSTGKPTITNMVRDAHDIFNGFKRILEEEGYSSSHFLMGRSLGSIPAVELAYHYQEQFKGLIIESGAANNFQRLREFLTDEEKEKLHNSKFLNKEKIASVRIPTCIIHGEKDQLLPVKEGLELYEASGAEDKDILIIAGGDHNDLMSRGFEQYFNTIDKFVTRNS
jgi:alpha-beta hydrolase superfamily lysophospholipase